MTRIFNKKFLTIRLLAGPAFLFFSGLPLPPVRRDDLLGGGIAIVILFFFFALFQQVNK